MPKALQQPRGEEQFHGWEQGWVGGCETEPCGPGRHVKGGRECALSSLTQE